MNQVDSKIEDFICEFRERIEAFSANEFDTIRRSMIAIKKSDDSHMGEEADRLWAEIRDRTYLFHRLDKEV